MPALVPSIQPDPDRYCAPTARPPTPSTWRPGATTPAVASAGPAKDERSGGSGEPTRGEERVHDLRHQSQARAQAARAIRPCAGREQHRADRSPHEVGKQVSDRSRREPPAGGRAVPRGPLAPHPRGRDFPGGARRHWRVAGWPAIATRCPATARCWSARPSGRRASLRSGPRRDAPPLAARSASLLRTPPHAAPVAGERE